MAANDGEVLGLEEPPAPLTLRNFPLLDRGWTPGLVLAGLVALSAGAGALAGSPAMGALLAAAALVTAWRNWAPVEFEFGPGGIRQTVLGVSRTVPWTRIARFEIRGEGVLVLGDQDRSPSAVAHALYINWGPHRESVLSLLRYYLEHLDVQAMQQSTRTSLRDDNGSRIRSSGES